MVGETLRFPLVFKDFVSNGLRRLPPLAAPTLSACWLGQLAGHRCLLGCRCYMETVRTLGVHEIRVLFINLWDLVRIIKKSENC